jgi:putative NIF3 family GTP cyclohydrolase 1 type 2
MVEANDRGLSVIDAGHAATERPGLERLRATVAEILDDGVELRS